MVATANPIHTPTIPWVPVRPGVSFRPIRFERDGWIMQLKVEPGTVIARHRHTGVVHALNISGWREIIDTGEIVGPGDYVHEPAGNTDSWRTVGDEPCVIHINVTGAVEYIDAAGDVTERADSGTQRILYLKWCAENGIEPSVIALADAA